MNGKNRARALAAARARLTAITDAIKEAKGDPRAIIWPGGQDRAIIMGEGAPPTRPEPPPRPLMRGRLRGIWVPFLYPRWMSAGYYVIDEIAISDDGTKTHPKKLTPTQEWKVEEARRVIAYYRIKQDNIV